MLYSEFEFVGYKGSLVSKTKIYKINEVPNNDKTENYRTIYRFTESIKKHDSVRDIGADELFYSDYLYFDIDFDELKDAEKEVVKLVGFLAEYDIGYEEWFSGSKGYHVLIPTSQFGFTPTNDERVLKYMAKGIATNAGVVIDEKIYNVSRVIREPYSLHRKTNNRKVPWPDEKAEYPEPDDYIPNDTLTALYQEVLKKLKVNTKLKATKGGVISRIFSQAHKGDRNQGCFVRAKMCRERKFHIDDTKVLLHRWNEEFCDPPLTDKEIDVTIRSAYRGDVSYVVEDSKSRVVLAKDLLDEVIESYKDFNKTVVKTGMPFFDQYTLGLFPGDMLFWIATNGNFKTAILSSLSQKIAENCDKYSLIFSSDMPAHKLIPRHVAYADCISVKQAINKLKKGSRSPAYLKQFDKVITINCPSLTVEEMYKDIERTEQDLGPLGFIGVDYLGAMKGCDNDTKRTSDTIHEAHNMVKEKGSCPLMMLVQARREYEGRGPGNIEIDKVAGKDASAIEHKADFILGSWWHGQKNNKEFWGRFLKARQYDSEKFGGYAYFNMDIAEEQMKLKGVKYRSDHPDFNQKRVYNG